MTTFRIAPHSLIPGKAAVEVFDGDALVAVIYSDGHDIKVVSKHIADAVLDREPPPAVTIRLAR